MMTSSTTAGAPFELKKVGGTMFRVPEGYEPIREVGKGAYGCVAAFRSPEGLAVAIKKMSLAGDLTDGRRIVREIRLLQSLEHPNIVPVFDLLPPMEDDAAAEVFLVMELMDTSLHRVLTSRQKLNDEHFSWFTAHLLEGLKYLHSRDVIHRDLKPANLLVNRDCTLKICDFGLARLAHESCVSEEEGMTDYVCTRWYRAPEVVLSASRYTKAIDMWSVGCILAEMLGRTPLFPGTSHLNQIEKIVEVLGFPEDKDVAWIQQAEALRFLHKCRPKTERVPLILRFPTANPEAIELTAMLLEFDPSKRPSAGEALQFPYLRDIIALPSEEKDHGKQQPGPGSSSAQNDEEAALGSGLPLDWSFDDPRPTQEKLLHQVLLASARFHAELAAREKISTASAAQPVPASAF